MSAAGIAIVGAGPAGLMAALRLAEAGHRVTVFDAMPSVGRKWLMAGKSGLNITHSEPHDIFLGRYGAASDWLAPALDRFGAAETRAFAEALGEPTFVGSSGRVFPRSMKGSPLLRAWLGRLAAAGAVIRTRHRLTGMTGLELRFETPDGTFSQRFDAVLLALGGASWPRLGSDAGWTGWLAGSGVDLQPFVPANCGFDADLPADFLNRFNGMPVKAVIAGSDAGTRRGEFVMTRSGVEGSLIYHHATALRDRIAADGAAILTLDLAPDRSLDRIETALSALAPKLSLSTRLKKAAGLDGVKAALIGQLAPPLTRSDSAALANLIKACPVRLVAPRPIAEAISSAGGVKRSALDPGFMLNAMPGVFAAGEMLDWEAPTGGYLITACLATGVAAADGIMAWLKR